MPGTEENLMGQLIVRNVEDGLLCVDRSANVLAYVRELLRQAGLRRHDRGQLAGCAHSAAGHAVWAKCIARTTRGGELIVITSINGVRRTDTSSLCRQRTICT